VFTQEKTPIITITIPDLVKKLNWNKVDFIKMDIEGYEYYAFSGCEELLCSDYPPQILFEFVDWAEKKAEKLMPGDAQNFLISKNYSLFEVVGEKHLPLNEALLKGSAMILAKKEKNIQNNHS
jgi:hypothetical protein